MEEDGDFEYDLSSVSGGSSDSPKPPSSANRAAGPDEASPFRCDGVGLIFSFFTQRAA